MNEMHKIAAAVDEYLTPFIESIILQARTEARAEGWNEGWADGYSDAVDDTHPQSTGRHTTNPYEGDA